jgi:CRP-like cAMP-binding protein
MAASDGDDPFPRNLLLSTFDPGARALLLPHCELVELKAGEIVLARGKQVQSSLFPLDQTMISMAVEMSGGRTVEVASIGREGAVGGIVSCGSAPAFSRAVCLVSGPALRVAMEQLEGAKGQSNFIANIFCRFSDFLLAQVMQSVACHAFHSIPERAARWLLHAQDRAGDRIELTQEAFAGLLGVQRTTVNAVVKELSAEGLVTTGRGTLRVVDRAGLERRSCECYARLGEHFGQVIGTSGSGDRPAPECG